jgi:asparagine synthase (glutamine-hydrolysing)
MCGIAGVLDADARTPADELAARASAMAGALEHRGPDGAGLWSDPAAGIAFGHRRLAIVDLSREGEQPMASTDGRWVVTYNGELYNAVDLKPELEATGVRFRGHCDTEVLVEALAAWGLEATLERANGMFAFAAWDRHERRLHLVRDRLGEKPLYYGWAGRSLLFGSELKALRRHPGCPTEIDRGAVALYLRLGYIPAPHTIYRGISKLPAATVVTVAGATASEPVPYWSLAEVAERGAASPVGPEALDGLHDLLADAVARRLQADVPVGVFLSGGIDSAAVAALAQVKAPSRIRTFTIGFDDPAIDEADHASKVAAHLGTDHTTLRATEADGMAIVPELAGIYDEPFADPSAVPTLLLSRLTRNEATVALSGDGGDEVFTGYNRYVMGAAAWPRMRWVPHAARHLAGRALLAVPHGRMERLTARAGPALRMRTPADKVQRLASLLDARSAADVPLALVSLWPDPEAIVINGREPRTVLHEPARWPRLPAVVDQLQALDSVTTLPDQMLAKVDRASMAASLEVRVPLLDHRVVELAWRLPTDLRRRGAVGKWALRQVAYRHVPAALLDQPKTGFDPPLGAWLRGPLRPWAEELLATDRLAAAGYLRPEPIRRIWSEHLAARRNWDYRLWSVLMFCAWLADWG